MFPTVPAEDLVFHKFYMNKLNSSKKPKKKKKKGAEDEGAEELFDVDDGEVEGGDESANEEIENLLDVADMSGGEEGEYDYDDLDRVAAEDDDEDLVGECVDKPLVINRDSLKVITVHPVIDDCLVHVLELLDLLRNSLMVYLDEGSFHLVVDL